MKHKNVLNSGHITLVDSMGDDHSVLKAARVSYGLEGKTGVDHAADAKLIHYLLFAKH